VEEGNSAAPVNEQLIAEIDRFWKNLFKSVILQERLIEELFKKLHRCRLIYLAKKKQ